jgi:hypothetical protein
MSRRESAAAPAGVELVHQHSLALYDATHRCQALAETLAKQLQATDGETVERAVWLAGLLRSMAFDQVALLAATRVREVGTAGPELYVAAARLHALVEVIDDELQSTAIDDVMRAAWMAQQAALVAGAMVQAAGRVRSETDAIAYGSAATAAKGAAG